MWDDDYTEDSFVFNADAATVFKHFMSFCETDQLNALPLRFFFERIPPERARTFYAISVAVSHLPCLESRGAEVYADDVGEILFEQERQGETKVTFRVSDSPGAWGGEMCILSVTGRKGADILWRWLVSNTANALQSERSMPALVAAPDATARLTGEAGRQDTFTAEEKEKETAYRKGIVADAKKRKAETRDTWKKIACDLGVPERTLRYWRHNLLYK